MKKITKREANKLIRSASIILSDAEIDNIDYTQGNIIVKDKPEYYKCSSTEVIKDAFSINDFNENENTVFVEGETDELYFNKMIKVFGLDLPFKIQQIGHTDAVGKDISSGKDSMDKIAKFFEGKDHQGILVFLYDSDAKRQDKDGEKVYTRSLSEYANSKDITMGIENDASISDKVIKAQTNGEGEVNTSNLLCDSIN